MSAGFEEIFAEWQPRLVRLFNRLLGRCAPGDDLAQEVLLKYYQNSPRLNGSPPAPWIYRVAVNLARDHLRKKTPVDWPEDFDAAGENETPADCESTDILHAALNNLSSEQREVVVLRHYEDMSFAEMSRMLDISESTLKSRFSKAMQLLVATLRHLEPPESS